MKRKRFEKIEKTLKTTMAVGIMLALFSTIAAADVKLDVPLFNQQDPAWGSDKLGSCSKNISQLGCAITSISMVFKYYGMDTNPKDMNDWLKAHSGYIKNGCDVKWEIADDKSAGTINWIGRGSDKLDSIKAELDNGYPVIAEVRLFGSQHFVVITGYSGDTLYINDPYYGDVSTINERYGTPKKGIRGTRIYHGPTVRITNHAVYCNEKDCTTTTVKSGDNLTFVYNISNPYAYNIPNVRLGA